MEAKKRLNNDGYHWLYLDGFMRDQTRHPYLREADGRKELYEHCPVYINRGETIVGNLDWVIWDEPVVNRTSMHLKQCDKVTAILDAPCLDQETKECFKKKLAAFEPFLLTNRINDVLTVEEKLAEKCGLFACCHYNGHQVMDYGFLLKNGVRGVAEIALRKLNEAAGNERFMFEAIAETFDAAGTFIARHAMAAKEILESGESGYDPVKLKKIIAVCEKISVQAPETFFEALQLHWFFMCFADYDSFGRFDQYLYPYYQASIAHGEDPAELKAQIAEYWRKLDQNGAILNMTIGGVLPDGSDAVNELTWLVLEVTRELKLKGPNLCLRVTRDSSDELWEAVRLGLDAGNSLPALYNDDVIVPMLKNHGIAPEDANGYCLAGCSQVIIPGKSSFACDMGLYNPLKCFELALNDGYDPLLRKQVGPHTGSADAFDSFEKLLAAYQAQSDYAIALGVSVNNKDHDVRKDFLSCIRSALIPNCMESGKGIFEGGAVYYAVQNEVVGQTNLANSLQAIREAVFEKHKYSLEEIVSACRADYRGYEEMRQYLLRIPEKFGNDEDRVDALRCSLMRDFFTRLSRNKAPLGGIHWPGEVIFHYHVSYGQMVGATPDGRLSGAPMADSAGAMQGTDMNGPTAILQSMMKLPFTTDDYPNTCSCLNLKFTRGLWDKHSRKIIDAFRVYFVHGGFQLQINILNQQDLINALVHPEQYRGLVVRVGGYNAYFVNLARNIQEDIIERHGQTEL